jgi:hypothetical protein
VNYLDALHSALLRAQKPLLAARLGPVEDPDVIPPPVPVPVLRRFSGPLDGIPEFGDVRAGPAEPLRLAPEIGFVNLPGKGGGVARSVPLVFRYRGELVPSFTLQAAMLWLGVTPDEVEVQPGRSIRLGGSAEIPVDAAGEMLVDFGVPIARHRYDDLILTSRDSGSGVARRIPEGDLRDAAVILARSDAACPKLRFANGREGTAGELFARGMATIQSGKPVRRVPAWCEASLLALLAVLLPALLRGKLGGAVAGLVLGTAFYLLGAISVFSLAQLRLPLALPLGMLAAGFLWRLLARPEPASPAP